MTRRRDATFDCRKEACGKVLQSRLTFLRDCRIDSAAPVGRVDGDRVQRSVKASKRHSVKFAGLDRSGVGIVALRMRKAVKKAVRTTRFNLLIPPSLFSGCSSTFKPPWSIPRCDRRVCISPECSLEKEGRESENWILLQEPLLGSAIQ